MTDLKDNVIESVKTILLPELKKLHDGQTEIRIRQGVLEKQMAIMNQNILDNGRRIGDTNKRIDEVREQAKITSLIICLDSGYICSS